MRFCKILIPLFFCSSSLFSQTSKEKVLDEVYDACFLKEYKHIYLYYYEENQAFFYRGYLKKANYPHRCLDCLIELPQDSTLFDKLLIKLPAKVVDSVRAIEAMYFDRLVEMDTLRNFKWDSAKFSKKIRVVESSSFLQPKITWSAAEENTWTQEKLKAKYQKLYAHYYSKPKEARTLFHVTSPIFFSQEGKRYFLCQITLEKDTGVMFSDAYEQRVLLFEYDKNKWKNIQNFRFYNY